MDSHIRAYNSQIEVGVGGVGEECLEFFVQTESTYKSDEEDASDEKQSPQEVSAELSEPSQSEDDTRDELQV